MRQIFQRFSPLTEKILLEAQIISEKYNRQIFSDCIILALVSDIRSLSGDILKQHGATIEKLSKTYLSESFAKSLKNNRFINSNQPGPNPELKDILQSAAKIAFQNKSVFLEPEHILLAILSEGESPGVYLLEQSGIDSLPILLQIKEFIFGISDANFIDDQIMSELFENDKNSFPKEPITLKAFSKNLTLLAEQKKLDPISCREKEIRALSQILSRRLKNNPIIVGEPGVGKTALVEGLAQTIVAKKVPKTLINKQIYSLDLGRLVAGTTYRGQFEERMTRIIEEASTLGNVIIFIDEMHTMAGAGSAEGSLDVAQMFKPSLAAGNFSVIGATTFDEYRRYIEKDRALSRRFSPLMLAEPSKKETFQILKKLKKSFENHHQVIISDSILEETVNLAEIYLPDKFFPDKAIDIIDEAAASAQPIYEGQSEVELIKNDIFEVSEQKLNAIDQSNYTVARELKEVEDKLHDKLMKAEKNRSTINPQITITTNHLREIVKSQTGSPVILSSPQKLHTSPIANPYHIFKKYIKGQDKALKTISEHLKAINFSSVDRKPGMSIILVGPTGVGKTETARIIARDIFGSADRLVKFDMSEYSERFSINSLIGSPAGYVGYEDGGKLTNAVRKKPFSVILFDEIEKAHPDIFNLLLQILEDGFLTDNIGRKVSFQNTVIILTSNIGNDSISELESIGFKANKSQDKKYKKEVKKFYQEQLLDFLSAELLGRITDVVVFDPLASKAISEIFSQEINEMVKIFNQSDIKIEIEDAAKVIKFLAKTHNSKEGARSIKKIVASQLKQKIIHYLDKYPNTNMIKVLLTKTIVIKSA